MRRLLRNILPGMAILMAASMAAICGAQAQGKTPKPSPVVQQEFNAFIKQFRAAIRANDSAAVTALTRLPFFYDHAMRDAAEFRAKVYPAYFTARNRACLQKARGVFDIDGLKNENFFLFCGEQIFIFTKTPAGFLFTDVGLND